MSNYERIKDYLEHYFSEKNINFQIEISMKESSYNEQEKKYLYSGSRELQVISMDNIAKRGYKVSRNASGRPLNTVDAFLVDKENDWYLIEFKDCKISNKKDNIEKKGLANFLMLLDIFLYNETIADEGYNNMFEFARNKVTYILVCSRDKDPYSYDHIRSCDNSGEKYTPECLQKFKDYFLKDAYAYTEEYFEQRFVKKFAYD